MSNRRGRRKQDDNKEQKIEDTSESMAHHIYFYHPGLVRKPCYNKSINGKPHYHDDQIYVQIDRGDTKYMWKLYRGYPKCQTHFQIHETWLYIDWSFNDRKGNRKHSLRFYQRPCGCHSKCCRGKNKKEIRFPLIEKVLAFEDRALFYKLDPIDPEKGTIYHCPMDVYRFQKKALEHELYENTKSLIIQHRRYKPTRTIRNVYGHKVTVTVGFDNDE